MNKILTVFQIFLAILLVLLILLQGRGAGLSPAFGGGGETFATRRGLEKILLYATIFVSILLTLTLLAAIFS